MRNIPLWLIPLLLASMLALSSCATTAQQPLVLACPKPQPVPAPLMQPPPKPLQTASKLQSLLFVPVTKPTAKTPSYGTR